MSEHPIENMMGITMEKIKQMVDVNTIIGDPITCPDNTVIIPVSRVGFGFAAGGSDWPSKQPKDLFGGGSGAGVSIQPIAFLVITNGNVKLLELSNEDSNTGKLTGMIPDLVKTVTDAVKKPKKSENDEKTEVTEEK